MLPKFHGLFTRKYWVNKKYKKCYQNFTDYLPAIVRSIKNIKSLTEISRIIYVEQNILAVAQVVLLDKMC